MDESSSSAGQRIRFLDPLIGSLLREAVERQTSPGRLAFGHDRLGQALAAFRISEDLGIRLPFGVEGLRTLSEPVVQSLVSVVEGALAGRPRLEVAELLIEIAEATGADALAAPWLDLLHGEYVHRRAGEQFAESWFQRAHAGVKDPARKASLALNLGVAILVHRPTDPTAVRYLREAACRFDLLGERDGALRARIGLLDAARLRGRFNRVAGRIRPASLISEDARQSADRLVRVGIMWRQAGDVERALPFLMQGRTMLAALGEPIPFAEATIALADAQAAGGQWQRALSDYRRALRTVAEASERGWANSYASAFHGASARIGLARAQLVLGAFDDAAATALEAVRLLEPYRVGHHLSVAWTLRARALAARSDNVREARTAAEAALSWSRRHHGERSLNVLRSYLLLTRLTLKTAGWWETLSLGTIVVRRGWALRGGLIRRLPRFRFMPISKGW